MTNTIHDQRKQLRNEVRERRKQQLRNDILAAAQTLLQQKGFASMIMDDVAALAGISKPTLYSYFATKDEVAAATVASEINRQLRLTEADHADTTPLARMVRSLEAIVQVQMYEDREPIRFWMPEIYRLSCEHSELMTAIQSFDQRLSELVREAIAIGEIDPTLDPATVVRSFYALISSIRFVPFSSIGKPNSEQAASTIATIFKHGVSANRGKQ